MKIDVFFRVYHGIPSFLETSILVKTRVEKGGISIVNEHIIIQWIQGILYLGS